MIKQAAAKDKRAAKVHYKYDTGVDSLKKSKKDFTKYLPAIIIWASRFNMFLLSYMYHTEVSFINVVWVLASFVIPS